MWVGYITTEPHIQIFFDIDGKDRGQNRLGADVFGIIARSSDNKGFILWNNVEGQDALNSLCSKNNTTEKSGLSCGFLIYQNGWEIPKDYPIKF